MVALGAAMGRGIHLVSVRPGAGERKSGLNKRRRGEEKKVRGNINEVALG